MIDLLFRRKNKIVLKKLEKHKKILQNNDNGVFKFKETKYGEPVLLFWSTDDEAIRIIHLFGIYKGKVTHSKINLIYRGDELFIADIQVLDKKIFNRGYGSLLLEISLQQAKECNIKTVEGILMTDNEAHFERQKHFYEKFGFTIIDESKIYLIL